MDAEDEVLLSSVAEAASQAKFAHGQCRFLADQCTTLVNVAAVVAEGKARCRVSSLLQQTLELLSRYSDPRRWLWEAVVRLENATGFELLGHQLHKCTLDMASEAVDRKLVRKDQVEQLLQRANMGMEEIKVALAACARQDRQELRSVVVNEKQCNPEMSGFVTRRLEVGSKILRIYSSESLELSESGPGFSGYRGTIWGFPVVVHRLQSWQEGDDRPDSGIIGVIEKDGSMLLVSEYDRTRELRELASYRMWEILSSSISMADPWLTDELLTCNSCEVLTRACIDLNASVQDETLLWREEYLEEVLSFLTKSLLMIESCPHVAPENAHRRDEVDKTLLEMTTLVDNSKADQEDLRGELVELHQVLHQRGPYRSTMAPTSSSSSRSPRPRAANWSTAGLGARLRRFSRRVGLRF